MSNDRAVLNSLLEVQQRAYESLEAHPRKVAERRAAIRAIRDAWLRSETWMFPPILEHDPEYYVWPRIDAGWGGSKHPTINLQRFGEKFGLLSKVGDTFIFTVNPDQKRYGDLCGKQWTYPDNRPEIEAFLKKAIDAARRPDLECEVQWQIARALSATKKAKENPLRHLRAVCWHGCFHEVSTGIDRAGNVANGRKKGDIDILVRSGKTFSRSLLCFEVKGPKETDAKSALYQSVRYATALDIEANGFSDEGGAFQSDYRIAFGPKPPESASRGDGSGKAYEKSKRRLDFGAVVVLPSQCRAQLRSLRNEVAAYLRLDFPGERRVSQVRALLYSWEKQKQEISGLSWYDWDS